ncbi:MAG: hypothetical protein V1777_04515 [Candidatus Micrarchaeota archaeon]
MNFKLNETNKKFALYGLVVGGIFGILNELLMLLGPPSDYALKALSILVISFALFALFGYLLGSLVAKKGN